MHFDCPGSQKQAFADISFWKGCVGLARRAPVWKLSPFAVAGVALLACWRASTEVSSKDLAMRTLLEILYRDLVKRMFFCWEIFCRELEQRSEILVWDLTLHREPCEGILHSSFYRDHVKESLPWYLFFSFFCSTCCGRPSQDMVTLTGSTVDVLVCWQLSWRPVRKVIN